jgi:hypothetical protein
LALELTGTQAVVDLGGEMGVATPMNWEVCNILLLHDGCMI